MTEASPCRALYEQNPDGHDHGELQDVKLVLHGTKEAPHYLRNRPIKCDVMVRSSACSRGTTAQ